MTARFVIALRRPLRAIALHAVPAEAAAAPASVRRLLALGADAEQTREDYAQRLRVLDTVLASLDDAVRQIPALVSAKLEAISQVATELGLALARAVVGGVVDRKLSNVEATVLNCLEQMANSAEHRQVTIHVAPSDLGAVTAAFAGAPDHMSRFHAADFVAEPSLEHGSVRVDSAVGSTLYDPCKAIESVCADVLQGLDA